MGNRPELGKTEGTGSTIVECPFIVLVLLLVLILDFRANFEDENEDEDDLKTLTNLPSNYRCASGRGGV